MDDHDLNSALNKPKYELILKSDLYALHDKLDEAEEKLKEANSYIERLERKLRDLGIRVA